LTNFILLLEIIDKYRILRLIYYIFFISVSVFIISGCSVSKNLKENQYLLSSETVEHNDKISKEALHGLYKKTPNNKVLGTMPYVAIYFFGEKYFDTSKVIKQLKKTEEIYAAKIAAVKESKGSVKKKEKLEKKLEKKKKHFANELSKGNWIMRVPGEAPVLFDSASVNQTAKQMTVYLHTHGFFRGMLLQKLTLQERKLE
jgi:outer membrane protein insertion porin family